jgi:hypothetical protein
MDFTLMIIFTDWSRDGCGVTSQLKTFPTKGLADRVAEDLKTQDNQAGHIRVLKLYIS